MRRPLSCLLILLFFSVSSFGQRDTITFLYTGKSLGALGNIRFQTEHELLTEQAVKDSIKFKIVSHACWRSKGIMIFLPSDEPEDNELELILEKRDEWKYLGYQKALKTDHVLMVQDPGKMEIDMLTMFLENDRVGRRYPDLQNASVEIYKTEILKDIKAIIVLDEDHIWPDSLLGWTLGEVNRVDFGKDSRLFELPYNYGQFGVRSKILSNIEKVVSNPIKIDLGSRNADLNMSLIDRAKIDFGGLNKLGYPFIVPYEFELNLGKRTLLGLKESFPDVYLLAANLSCSIPGLLRKRTVIERNGIKIGCIGVVDPDLQQSLPKKILENYTFQPLFESVRDQIDSLYLEGCHWIVVFSNMSAQYNEDLAENVNGIHVVACNFSSHGIPYPHRTEVTISQSENKRMGYPFMMTQNFDFGIAIGELSLVSKVNEKGMPVLEKIGHSLHSVDDRTEPDFKIMTELKSKANIIKHPKGDLMFPAFVDLADKEPSLENFDKTTQHGRVSKALWEQFLARVLREHSPAEVSLLRKVPSFLPLIGKLHEREVRSWLWQEDEIVMLDMQGKDLVRLLETGIGNNLITSGIQSFLVRKNRDWFVMGRFMGANTFYRIATTNVIVDGPLSEFFQKAIRVNKNFNIKPDGTLKNDKKGSPVSLRDYVLNDLKRIRNMGKGGEHHSRIAQLLLQDPNFEKLFSIDFVKPTLWTTLNRTNKSKGYESVPESRIIANNSFVLGIDGGVVVSYDAPQSAIDVGTKFGYAKQNAELPDGSLQNTENMDDLLFSLTYFYKGRKEHKHWPMLRGEYDTEFSPTINSVTGFSNPTQQILRGIVGISKDGTSLWPTLEFGATVENDFTSDHTQFGLQFRSYGRLPLDKEWRVRYIIVNNFNYNFKSLEDTERELAFKYNSVHSLQIPLFGDLSLSVAADFFLFKGKLDSNNRLGLNMLYRAGITYNRLWKPRFSSFF